MAVRANLSSSSYASLDHSNTAPGTAPDKVLFTPGPLLTSYPVKAAMLRDLGSRDTAFVNLIKDVRSGVLKLAGVSANDYTMIPMQGSGTFGVEATVSSVVPSSGRLLIVANGAYGQRIEKMAKAQNISHKTLLYGDDTAPSLEDIEHALSEHKDITHVACVHSETTSGIINDIHTIGKLVKKHKKTYIVDAMSSFGAVPIDFASSGIDYLVTSANKCVQGVPGFAIIIAKKSALQSDKGNARSLSLDIHDQVQALDKDGQFRFTPPTHALLAFNTALNETFDEGGVEARHKRYANNRKIIEDGMLKMGFKAYLKPQLQGPIISTYLYPKDAKWDFARFYNELNDRGHVIYPGKVTNADGFRIGNIGHLFPEHCEALLKAIKEVVGVMGFDPSA